MGKEEEGVLDIVERGVWISCRSFYGGEIDEWVGILLFFRCLV